MPKDQGEFDSTLKSFSMGIYCICVLIGCSPQVNLDLFSSNVWKNPGVVASLRNLGQTQTDAILNARFIENGKLRNKRFELFYCQLP